MHGVTLPPTLAVTLPAPELWPPSQAQIQAHVETLLLNQARFQPVARPSQWGDRLTLDTLATCGGQIMPASVSQGMALLLRPGGEPWSEQLIGLKAGEQRTLSILLPSDYSHPAWQGQEARYQVTVKRVDAVTLPTPEAAIAKAYGPGDTGQRQLLAQLQAENERSWRQYMRLQVAETVTAHSQVSYPPEWLDDQLSQSWEQEDAVLLRARKLTPEALEQARQTFLAFTPLRQAAAHSLEVALVLREVALQAGITLERSDFEAMLQSLAQAVRTPVPQLVQRLKKEQALTALADQQLLDQALSHLMGLATLVYREQAYALA